MPPILQRLDIIIASFNIPWREVIQQTPIYFICIATRDVYELTEELFLFKRKLQLMGNKTF